MKTVSVIVPRSLIKHHSPHPEPYGESIVVLENDMCTDVYTGEDGTLYTQTNNQELIDYLQRHQMKEPRLRFAQQNIVFRSACVDDVLLLKSWMNSSENWMQQAQTYDDDDIRIFISHAITMTSHFFVIEAMDVPIATLAYELNGDELLVDFRVYKKEQFDASAFKQGFMLLLNRTVKTLGFGKLLSNVLKEDMYHQALLTDLGFCEEPSKRFKTQLTHDISKESRVFVLAINVIP